MPDAHKVKHFIFMASAACQMCLKLNTTLYTPEHENFHRNDAYA